MLQEEKMRKIIAELSREMIAWKRQWLDLARTNEQYKREDTVEELKGDYQRTIKHNENMMIELDSFFYLEVPLIECRADKPLIFTRHILFAQTF